jgi:hypothetical protein
MCSFNGSLIAGSLISPPWRSPAFGGHQGDNPCALGGGGTTTVGRITKSNTLNCLQPECSIGCLSNCCSAPIPNDALMTRHVKHQTETTLEQGCCSHAQEDTSTGCENTVVRLSGCQNISRCCFRNFGAMGFRGSFFL